MSLSQVQTIAVQALIAVDKGKNLSDELTNIISQHPQLSTQDKGMLQDIAYGSQRFSGSLRFMLNQMLNKPIPQTNVHYLLLIALYQLNHTQNAPHAVVNETVKHIARIEKGQYRSLANAILRRFLREKTQLNAKCKQNEVAHYNLPLWLKNNLMTQYPKYWHNIITAFQKHPPLTLRINRRRSNAQQYLSQLQQAGLDGKILDEYAIKLHTPIPINKLPEFHEGTVSIQDFGAQQAAYLINPKDNERILDACAAPGGKTGHLLELANCQLTALDIDAKRLERVAENLKRLNFQAVLHCAAAENLNDWWDNKPFDAILADVPCTASGTIKRNPDIKWLRRPSDALKTAKQQEKLLDNLWQTLKDNGRMLLATCSIFAEENHLQCQKFLARHKNALLIEEKTILPNDNQDGFYYALIRKQATN